MQQISTKDLIDAAKQRAATAIDQGLTELTLTGPNYLTAMMRRHIGDDLKARGIAVKITKATTGSITLSFTPGEPVARPGQRGRPKSEERLAIEGLNPGQTTWVELEDTDVYKARAIVADVKRVTGRQFMTEVENDGGTLAVTRVDNLDQAPDYLQDSIAEHVKARGRWPFSRLEPGDHERVVGAHDLPIARSLAAYHKRKHGKSFSVEAEGGAIKITRLN